MRYISPSALALLARCAYAAPAPQMMSMGDAQASQAQAEPINPSAVINMPLPSGASGSLRSSEALLGYNPSNPITKESTVIPPSDFELGPGQSNDADLGLYIDLSNVKNPQPIRGGTTGPTEPGPRYELLPVHGSN
jgi:hypothetical protein